MKKSLKSLLLLTALTFSWSSCSLSDYDLSDIDGTIGLKVNDLTIPLNLDEVTLKSVLDLDEDSQIKEVNGEYAVVEEGNFHSDGIDLPSFSIEVPNIDPIYNELTPDLHLSMNDLIGGGFGVKASASRAINIPDDYKIVSFDIVGAESSFHVNADVEDYIIDIEKIGVDATIHISFNFNGIEHLVNAFELENLSIQLPKGLIATASNGGTYNKKTGKIHFGRLTSNNRLEAAVDVTLTEIDAEAAGAQLKYGKFSFSNEFAVTGTLCVYGHNLKNDINVEKLMNIGNIQYQCDIYFQNDQIKVESFTGDIQYTVEGFDIDPVSLEDIPDFLNQEGTNIKLANPQIYLALNNPVYEKYGVYATTGLEFIVYPNTYEEEFKVDVKIDDTDNQFCLSPTRPNTYYKTTSGIDFSNAEHITFSNLGNILSGNGLPESIEINVTDPQIPVQHVENCKLGQNLGAIQGTYVFYAPLALTEGSKIKYSETFNEWSDSETDNITISQLKVEANITSNIPFELALKAYPIDKYGNKITDNGKIVEGKAYMNGSDVIPANANGALIIEINGTVRELDGIILDAEIHGMDASNSVGNALKPGHSIKLDQLKMKISGEYISKL